MNKRLQIAVIGSAGKEEYTKGGGVGLDVLKKAEEIGSLLAQKNVAVVTGGKGGIMEAAARGAKSKNGITLGIIKGTQRFSSNSYTDIEVLSGMTADGLDELVLVLMSDALIVLGGGAGTLQELAIAYRNKKPIIALNDSGGWATKVEGSFLDERETILIELAKTPEEAANKAINLAKQNVNY